MAYVTPPHVQARKRRIRTKIIDTAVDLFAEKGYESCSIKDIVERAETSVGNCYFYFKDKEDLLKESTRRLCRRIDIRINRLVKRFSQAPARMAAALWMGSLLMVRHKNLARMLFIEAPKTRARAEVMRFLRRRVELGFSGSDSGFNLGAFAEGLFKDQEFITVAWTGAVWGAFESVAREELVLAGDELGRRLVYWNLGALGFNRGEIEKIIHKVKREVAVLEQMQQGFVQGMPDW